MRLDQLAHALPGATLIGDGGVEVTAISHDSRQVGPGHVFAAIPGFTSHGERFIPQALSRGAVAILAETRLEGLGAPLILVPNARQAHALAAAELLGRPAQAMCLAGITGTKGKTTTSYILEAMLAAAGRVPGVMGTISVRWPGQETPAALTTPEGSDLQAYLAAMREAGVSHVVFEASSHALSLDRLAGCLFQTAVFTNLGHDHLDFHAGKEEYFAAKTRLFTRHLAPEGKAVINLDDAHGRRLAGMLPSARVVTYGQDPAADIQGRLAAQGRDRTRLHITTPQGDFEAETRLIGALNLPNFLAATGAALALGLTPGDARAGIERMRGVPGRLERVGRNPDYLALVDYAHTPEALALAIASLRGLAGTGRIITVFGCGGDRDKAKRPLMGRAASQGADLTIVTSDNPRTEDPAAIIRDILAGVTAPLVEAEALEAGFTPPAAAVEPDRARAIALGARLMNPGDVLFIAGKGHEDYQILGRKKIHLDDREEALAALERQGKA